MDQTYLDQVCCRYRMGWSFLVLCCRCFIWVVLFGFGGIFPRMTILFYTGFVLCCRRFVHMTILFCTGFDVVQIAKCCVPKLVAKLWISCQRIHLKILNHSGSIPEKSIFRFYCVFCIGGSHFLNPFRSQHFWPHFGNFEATSPRKFIWTSAVLIAV